MYSVVCPASSYYYTMSQTWSVNVFQQAENAVNCSVSEDDDIIGSKEDIKHVEDRCYVLLTRLVYFLVRRILDLHRSQGTK